MMPHFLEDFNSFLDEKGIKFYYINAGSKVNPDDKQLSGVSIMNEHSNENGDKLLAALEARGVKNVDMRKLMKEDNLDWYGSYYITDHHWTSDAGLWCASKIAALLNEDAGFEYNMELFDESSYDITTYDNFWFGGQANALKLVDCEREPYDLIIPKFDTYFEVSIPSKEYEKSGDYEEAVIDTELFEAIKNYEDTDFLTEKSPYYLPVWQNDALGTIKNSVTQDNKDKKILFLQDSFGWYSETFIACDTGEVDLIHPMGFDGSIRAYINQTEPDVVIMLYCERNIKAIDWSTHKSQFDLR
jgi:hypothetical protein